MQTHQYDFVIVCARGAGMRAPWGPTPVQTQLEQRAFLLLLGLVSVAFAWLLLPFYGAVFWAVILAIVFQPLQRMVRRRWGLES